MRSATLVLREERVVLRLIDPSIGVGQAVNSCISGTGPMSGDDQ